MFAEFIFQDYITEDQFVHCSPCKQTWIDI